jgi:hypothetical protein
LCAFIVGCVCSSNTPINWSAWLRRTSYLLQETAIESY